MYFNRTNMAKLIAHMEKMPDKAFNLNVWISGKLGGGDYIEAGRVKARNVIKAQEDPERHDCGTVACIAGTAAILAAARRGTGGETRVKWLAADWLGIDSTDADRLFLPGDNYFRRKVTRKGALRVLKHLMKTGELEWRRVGAAANGMPWL